MRASEMANTINFSIWTVEIPYFCKIVTLATFFRGIVVYFFFLATVSGMQITHLISWRACYYFYRLHLPRK